MLSERLKIETADEHERMHALMHDGQPFANRQRYGRFVAAQWAFQGDLAQLMGDPALRAIVPDLALRARQDAALADLHDLGAPVPDEAPATSEVTMPQALGWVYVAEGSTLGAAFLLKEAEKSLGLSATFGARCLAAYPEGRLRVWRRFTETLDGPDVPAASHDAVIAGALQAYARFGDLLRRQFSL